MLRTFPSPAPFALIAATCLAMFDAPALSDTRATGAFVDTPDNAEIIWSVSEQIHTHAFVSLALDYTNDRFRLSGQGGEGNCQVRVDFHVTGNMQQRVRQRCRVAVLGDVIVEGTYSVTNFRRTNTNVQFTLAFNGEVWDEIATFLGSSPRGATLGTMGKAWNVQGSFVSPAERQRIAQQQAQQQRLAQEQAEQQRLAQQQAEQQRLAQQQAEQQRLAQQQAEQRRLAQQQAEQRRLAQQQAEQQRLAQQQAEQRRLAQQQQAASQSASGERFVNVARGKQATQSSTGFDAPADRAIDGNRDGDFWRGSVTHTAEGGGGSWQVDLGAVYDIDRVQIFNRTDCCMERLQAALVVANFPVVRNASEAVFVQRLGDMATRSSLVVHVNARGRYVSVVQQTGEFLHLAEVEVLVKSQ